MKLAIQTTKGTKNYSLSQTARGIDVYRVTSGFFSSSSKFVGHGHDTPAAILVARVDAGDSSVRAVHLRN